MNMYPPPISTEPHFTSDGNVVTGRVTRVDGGYTVEVIINGIAVVDGPAHSFYEKSAERLANRMAIRYTEQHNAELADELESEARTERLNAKHDRIAFLRRRIELTERELLNVRLELAELLNSPVFGKEGGE